MKVDVAYTLADRSKNRDDFELRMSLRSLAQQDWVRNIYMIGHKPAWAKNVIHIPCDDPFTPKDANIINKILTACKQEGVSDQFVVNSDDHYILRKIALEELGPWLENPSQLADSFKKYRQSTWHRRLIDTVKWCKINGHPEHVWECHIPYMVDKGRYIRAFRRAPYKQGNGLCSHVYFNIYPPLKPVLEEPTMTIRLKEEVAPEQLAALTAKATFFNHNDNGLCAATKAFLEQRFPKPSPWE